MSILANTSCFHPAWVEIDLSQFQRNLIAIRKRIGSVKFCLPVKANAYGHGLLEIARAAESARVVDFLGVSCLKEGVFLREQGISLPILVFGAFHEDQIDDLIRYQFDVTASSRLKASLLLERCQKQHATCRVHIEVDTGMNRTGMRPETARELLLKLRAHPELQVVGLSSHLATADQPNHPFALQQIETFTRFASEFAHDNLLLHIANSGGVVFYPSSHFNMVRPGLLSYGYFPDGSLDPLQEIAPCFSLKARVSYFKVVGPNAGISYGHLYRTAKQSRIATIPIGYGDGYFRRFSNRGHVLIRGQKYTIAGAVCMDQFMVDLGDGSAYVGDEVVLIGMQGKESIHLQEVASIADTIPYEILCALNDRLTKVYTTPLS